jgi:hypothetical protein
MSQRCGWCCFGASVLYGVFMRACLDLRRGNRRKERTVADILFLALSVVFFAATIGMAYLFEQLRGIKK